MKLCVTILLLAIAPSCFSQSCNCEDRLQFAIDKIENNYAGFADKVNRDTKYRYEELTRNFLNKAGKERNADSCLKLVREWLRFFRDGHLVVRNKTIPANRTGANNNPNTQDLFYFKKLDEKTNLIRIGSFNHVFRKVIDSVVNANISAITASPYLVIDLRGNGGGSDVSYSSLIPFIYTNPIEVIGSAKLSTPDNMHKFELVAADTFYGAESRQYARKMVARMKASPGEFIQEQGDTVLLDNIAPYPSLVGILVDKKCGSTTEQFLLAARQSKRTVLVGENSQGVLDYANMHFLDFPCKDWQLGYATSRSMRLPGMPVDNIGIAPDVRLDDKVKDWVDFTSDYLKRMPVNRLKNYQYTDTSMVQLNKIAMDVAGKAVTTFDKVNNIIWWTNKNFFWAFTDYQRRTVKQIICREGGNCNEQALVVRALLRELNVKTRKTVEINIQPESKRRLSDAEKKIHEMGNRASVFGFRHNDHVWIEFFDEESKQWVPADPTLGLIGLDNWLKSRIGFEPRVNHAVVASAEMLVPIAVFALNPDGSIAENRSEYYLLQSFNEVYKKKLEQLPAWAQWKDLVLFIQEKSRHAFEGKENLHGFSDTIGQMKEVYLALKAQYDKENNR